MRSLQYTANAGQQAWGTIWEIPVNFNPEGKRPSKLQRWIETYPQSGKDVLFILSAISDIFADTSSLVKKYGITLSRRDPVFSESRRYRSLVLISSPQALRDLRMKDLFSTQKDKVILSKDVEHRRQHMSIVNRCHFQLRGGAEFDALIARIIEYVDSLFKMCSEAQAEVMSLCQAPELYKVDW